MQTKALKAAKATRLAEEQKKADKDKMVENLKLFESETKSLWCSLCVGCKVYGHFV